MREIDNIDELEATERAILVGVTPTSQWPLFAVQTKVVAQAEDNEYEAVSKRIAEWWDSLGVFERAELLNIADMGSREMFHHLEFIDEPGEKIGQGQTLWRSDNYPGPPK